MGAAEQARAELADGRKAHQNSRSGLTRLFVDAFGPDRADMWFGVAVTAAYLTYGEGVKSTWTFESLGTFIESYAGDIF